MADQIKITQVFTANRVKITVKMPGKPDITKRWKRKAGGGYAGDFTVDWTDEPSLPQAVARAADQLHTDVCDEIKMGLPRIP